LQNLKRAKRATRQNHDRIVQIDLFRIDGEWREIPTPAFPFAAKLLRALEFF
jgi:hypothetical protein